MPFNTEDLADKFGSSAEDIRNNLDGLIEKAEDADKAFENLTKRQEYAVKIQDKFATAMTASSKSMVLFGRSGNTAVRGLKAVGAISRTVASSLGSIGVGAGAAAGGFKALSSEASSFTSDISRTERSIAGFVARIGGLEKKLKGIKSASVPVEMVVGNLSALDNIEKRLKALPKNVKVNLSTVSAGAASQAAKPPSAKATSASAKASKKALKPGRTMAAAAAKAAKAATAKAQEAVEELHSPFDKLREEADKTTTSLKDLFKKDVAKDAVRELEDFAGGAAKSATGMMAAGLAVAYLASKLGDLAKKFADAAAGLARYKTETVSLERTLIGISNGGLEQMRKQLEFTRGESAEFFEVVKKGVNQLGLSQGKIMEVSNAIAETFGAPITERLRQYIDLLESIPTIESDLKVTANMDDQAAAIFALAEAGKIEVVRDLQGAGLLGGKKEKRPGADMSNAAAKTARVTEEIQDFLLSKLYPDFGQYLSAIVSGTAQVVAGMFATLAAYTALSFLTRAAMVSNVTTRAEATGAIITPIRVKTLS
jgi:hypothetical protein